MPVYPRELPASMRENEKKRSETALYDLLKKTLPEGYSAIYNLELTSAFDKVDEHNLVDVLTREVPDSGTFPMGEVDFLLITPRCLLVIEVKGGELTLEDGTWYREPYRQVIESPLAQGRRNMFALCGTLKNGWRFHRRFIPTGYAAILPHTPAWNQGGGLGHWDKLLLFRENCSGSLVKKLEEALTFWADLWKAYTGRQESLTDSDIRHIVSVCAVSSRLSKPRVRRDMEEFKEQLLKVTESQYVLLRSLAGNRKAVITGGAGTGKTLLAMEKARQVAAQGHWTLFTCANRLLSRHIKEHLKGVENLEVMNFHELCYNWGFRAGIPNLTDPDGPEGKGLTKEYFHETLPEVLFEAAQVLDHRYDAVIVDEAQDMHDVYWTALQFCMKEEGPIFYIFCDPQQSIWNLKDTLPFDEPNFHLTDNLRNSKKVFSLLKNLTGQEDYAAGCEEAGEFRIIPIEGEEELEQRLRNFLSRLARQGVMPRDVTVLTGRSRELSRLAPLKKVGKFALTRDLHSTEDKVLFSSVRQFRGMESPVVIMVEVDAIIDLEKLQKELQSRYGLLHDSKLLENLARETLAIGISRAQHSLFILADADTVQKLKAMGVEGEREKLRVKKKKV